MIRRLLIFFLFGFYTITASVAANTDTVVVRDLSHEWYFYNSAADGYLPLVNKHQFKENTIHFDVLTGDYINNQLRISSIEPVSIFINNNIVDIISGESYYSFDSLRKQITGEQLHFTIYGKNLNPFSVATEVIDITHVEKEPLADNAVIIKRRESNSFDDFSIVAVILLGGFLAALFNYFPRVLNDFFKVSRTFSMRETDENLLKSRPFSRTNLLFCFYLSLLIALVLMLLINQLDIHFESAIFYPEGFLDGFWKWIRLAAIIACWFIGKYLLIQNMSALFYLRNFVVSHYFNYIRMTLLIFTAGLIIILGSFYALEIMSAEYYRSVYNFLLIFLGIRILILFLKLLGTGSYKSLHLFSYLCGTEVIPFVILLYLGINQPF